MAKIRRYENRVIPQAVGTPGVDRSGQILAGGIQQAAEGMYDLGMSQKREAAQEERARAEEALKAQRQVQEVSDAAEFGRLSIGLLNLNEEAQKTTSSVEEYQGAMRPNLNLVEADPDLSPAVKSRAINYLGELTRSGSITMAAEVQKRAAEKALINTDETIGGLLQKGSQMSDLRAIEDLFSKSEPAKAVQKTLGDKAYKVLTDTRDAAYKTSLTAQMVKDPIGVINRLKTGTGLPKSFPEALRVELLKNSETALINYGNVVQTHAMADDIDLTSAVVGLNAKNQQGDSYELLYSARKQAEAQYDRAQKRGDVATMQAASRQLAGISGLEVSTGKSSGRVPDDPAAVGKLEEERANLVNKKGRFSGKTDIDAYIEYIDLVNRAAIRQEISTGMYTAIVRKVLPAAGTAALRKAGELTNFWGSKTDYGNSPEGIGEEELQSALDLAGKDPDLSKKGQVHLDYLQDVAHFRKTNGRGPSTEEAVILGKAAARKSLGLPEMPGVYILEYGEVCTIMKDGSISKGVR